MKTKKILSLILATALVFSFGCISAFAADAAKVYENGETAILNLEGNLTADGCDGAIWAKGASKLTINGTEENVVTGSVCTQHGYSMAVWAQGEGTTVVINGGYYKNELDETIDPAHVDLIYASEGANIVINGGKFECATPQWTLNCKNFTGSTITVNGGKFYKFNPLEADTDGENEIVLGEGRTVVKNGDWYEVVKVAGKVYDADDTNAILTLDGSFVADGCDGAIWAKDGAKLTINGNNENLVKGLVCTDHGYSMAVWAKGEGTAVEINGGYYKNELDSTIDPAHVDLIYASEKASIVINGGTFECATPQWTLNCKNFTGSKITVNGGRFYKFDPSNAMTDGENEIVLGEGCKVVQDGDWYEVVKGESASITFDSKEVKKDAEGKGAIRFVFNVSIPNETQTYFGAYIIPLELFKSSGVAEAVQVQYDTNVATTTAFSADLVKIPESYFGKDIYAIPYIKTAKGLVTFAGASAAVQ